MSNKWQQTYNRISKRSGRGPGSTVIDLFNLVGRYFWLIALGFCAFGYLRSSRRPPPASATASMAQEIRFYRCIWFSAQALLWLVMGAGILCGGVKDVWDFMRPQEGRPFVLAFAGLGLAGSLGFAWWTFAGGARKMVDLHLGEQLGFRDSVMTERGAKFLAVSGLVTVPFWLAGCLFVGSGATGDQRPLFGLAASAAPMLSPDGYQTVYDLAQAGLRTWSFAAFGLLFVAMGVCFVYFRNDLPMQGSALMRRMFPFVWLTFAILWTLVTFSSTYVTHRRLMDAIASAQAQVVEGEVTRFVPMPASGHAMERFCVQQDCFAYSDYVVTGGFNNAASHGGPIRNELAVRVTHVGGTIVKLELAPDKR